MPGPRATLVLSLFLLLLALDACRAPERQWTTAFAIGAIHGYQRTLAPRFAAAGLKCRFTPTCSHYAEEVLRRHGIVVGGWRALARITRCGPWTPAGTVDPPS
jgi:putative membrane protein insertion efficiency factor